jgi:hypothetical protein
MPQFREGCESACDRVATKTPRMLMDNLIEGGILYKSSRRTRARTRLESSQSFTHFIIMRFAALVLALPAIVAATAIPRQAGNCNTGSVQCCNQVQQVSTLSTMYPTIDLTVFLGEPDCTQRIGRASWHCSSIHHWTHWL